MRRVLQHSKTLSWKTDYKPEKGFQNIPKSKEKKQFTFRIKFLT